MSDLASSNEPKGLLWQNLEYGMHIGEILCLQPSAISVVNGSRLNRGDVLKLLIKPAIQLTGHVFYAELYCVADKLTQVTLTCDETATRTAFQTIRTALRVRYGDEISSTYSELTDSSDAEWVTNTGANISLNAFPGIGVFNIVYQYRLKTDAAKL